LVSLTGVHFRYGIGPWILDGIDLTIQPGDRILIRGPNGCGKSTLLKLLAGRLQPDNGSCQRHQNPCTCCALLSQTATVDLSVPMRAKDLVAQGTAASDSWWKPWGGSQAAVQQALEAVGLGDRSNESPARLSGGQLRRLLIARALAQGAKMLLFDEPLSGLDAEARRNLADVLDQVTGPGKAALVMASHEVENHPLAFDRDLHFLKGRLVDTADAHCELAS
jgi:ABC-type Mn2+/Zn2+ transport system ATPase subunit